MNIDDVKLKIIKFVKEKCEKDLSKIRKIGGVPQPTGYSLQDLVDLLGKEFLPNDVRNAVSELVNEKKLAIQGRDDLIHTEYDLRGNNEI